MKRLHTIRISSDDVVSEQDFWLTPESLNLVLEIAQKFNAAATFSVGHRVEIEPSSAAHPGEVA